VATAVLAGCVASTGVASPTTPDASASPTASPVGSSSGSPAASGFYLRAWQTQALAPQYTFTWLPSLTISGGEYIDGMVAVPMIYPGPIYVGLSVRPISSTGIEAIVAEARKDGLLGDKSSFSETALPGSISAHIRLVVDGVAHDLSGSLPTDASTTATAPGTASAFSAFWNRIGNLAGWLGADLGQSSAYSPTSIAVMLTPPVEATGAITAKEAPWPLSSTFATFGSAMAGAQYRCGVVSGADLALLLPVVQASNALTRFVDSTGAKNSLQVRVLLPGESGPCA
jgi:hypothetical protein